LLESQVIVKFTARLATSGHKSATGMQETTAQAKFRLFAEK
jgi:hypothetical protein